MKEIWIKSATAEDFAKAEILDWFEGVGMITSHFEKDFIRRLGRHLTSKCSGREYSCSCSAVKRIGVGKFCPDCGGRNSRR